MRCSQRAWHFTTTQGLPLEERLWRISDTLLYESGYAQAQLLADEWTSYTAKLTQGTLHAPALDVLVNEPAILGLLQNPKGPLAPVFEQESAALLDNFANGALKAWRLRSIDQKIVLARDQNRLAQIDIGVIRREVGIRYFSIPIQSMGNNYVLDGEWDITRFADFPLSQARSTYMFLTTDKELNILSLGNTAPTYTTNPDWIRGSKFNAPLFGIHKGQRIFSVQGKDFNLIIVYPFAGYAFYAIRGAILLLVIVALLIFLVKLATIRLSAKHVLENRQKNWLNQHYEESLAMNAEALQLGDKALGVVSSLKEREARIIGEFGRHLHELSNNFTAESRLLIEEAQKTQSIQNAQPLSKHTENAQVSTEKKAPLHKKAVYKKPILINAKEGSEIEVSIELDLPLTNEKELSPHTKATYIGSLRRRAQEKAGIKNDYLRDETVENYSYPPEPPLPMPQNNEKELPRSNKDVDLSSIQNFRYTGKKHALPLVVPEDELTK
ncbi:MAG TPA: hypothetical protein PLY93_06300 [Turneriella sp.]|nr:hypothetical protein [Turneriella sp.]